MGRVVIGKGVLPLSFRREMADIKVLFQSMYTNNSNVSKLVQVYIPNGRLSSNREGMLLQPKLLRAEKYKGFYSNRIVTLWN